MLAQEANGKLIDSETKVPVAYANIGVLSQGIGTVSDNKGRFSLAIPSAYDEDTLVISIIGYEPLSSQVSAFKSDCANGCTLEMKQIDYKLESVEIESKALNRKVVGIDDPSESISIGFSGKNVGIEAGTYMKLKRPAYLDKVNIAVGNCEADSMFFRLNVYDVKRGMPNNNVLKRPIYLSRACEDIRKSFEVDLSEEGIYMEDDFIVALENVKQDNIVKSFFFKGKMFSKGIFYRYASQDDWQKIGIVAAGISAVVLEEKK